MRRAAVIAALVLAGASGCSVTGPARAPAPSSPSATATVHASGRIRYLGYAGPPGSMARFAAATGAHPDMATQYLQPGDRFDPPPAGITPFLSLATVIPVARLLAGDDDVALTVLGREVAAWGKPSVISIDPEGNGPWYSYGTQQATAAQYVAAYRHVETVLKAAGVKNATWAWTISNSPPITHQVLLRSLYPGDAWVQLVGIDGYFIGSENSWDQVFARVFAEVRQFTARPFLIAETSVQPGTQAAQWVRELFAGAETTPGVLGFIWFDFDKAAENRDDWRLEDDPAALAAFRATAARYGS